MISGAGLFDLQVNGYAGVDFNHPAITAAALDGALETMLASGVTQCLPTLITAHPAQLCERFTALDAAVASSRLGPLKVPGYHLEGPFLNAADGYAGCHPPEAMSDPDIGLIDTVETGLLSGIVPVIPPKANRKNPPQCDFKAYEDRNRIERMFNRLKQFRRIATRFDKTAKSFAAFLALAAARIWMPHFVNRA